MPRASPPFTPQAGVPVALTNPASGGGKTLTATAVIVNLSPFELEIASAAGSIVALIDPFTRDSVPAVEEQLSVMPLSIGFSTIAGTSPSTYVLWYAPAEQIPGNLPSPIVPYGNLAQFKPLLGVATAAETSITLALPANVGTILAQYEANFVSNFFLKGAQSGLNYPGVASPAPTVVGGGDELWTWAYEVSSAIDDELIVSAPGTFGTTVYFFADSATLTTYDALLAKALGSSSSGAPLSGSIMVGGQSGAGLKETLFVDGNGNAKAYATDAVLGQPIPLVASKVATDNVATGSQQIVIPVPAGGQAHYVFRIDCSPQVAGATVNFYDSVNSGQIIGFGGGTAAFVCGQVYMDQFPVQGELLAEAQTGSVFVCVRYADATY